MSCTGSMCATPSPSIGCEGSGGCRPPTVGEATWGPPEATWFDEWDHELPWANADFEKLSPRNYATKFKTPNLVIPNPLECRVPLMPGLIPMRVQDETNTGFL